MKVGETQTNARRHVRDAARTQAVLIGSTEGGPHFVLATRIVAREADAGANTHCHALRE